MNAEIPLASAVLSVLLGVPARDPNSSAGARTYTVEVVTAERGTSAVAIRATAGAPSRAAGDDPVATLKAVRPGDTLTISVGDDATGERHSVVAVVSGSANYQERPSEGPISIRDSGTPWELVELDREARKITVLDEQGRKQVFLVDEKALLDAPVVTPGQKVMLAYRFGKDGKPEAVIRLAPARAQGTVVQVISADAAAKTLTILRPGGDTRTLAVDQLAAVSLRDLKRGETVVLGFEGDKVVVITRKR